jgi:hypothetical protein
LKFKESSLRMASRYKLLQILVKNFSLSRSKHLFASSMFKHTLLAVRCKTDF